MPISIPKRPVDVWVISADPVHSTGNFFEGLPVQGTAHATGDRLAAALGDVSSWGFDPHGRADWAVTHLREELEQRVAFEDLTFEPQPPPAAPEPTVNPRVISGRLTKKGSGLRGREVFVLFGLVLFVAVAAIVGWSTEERSRRD